MFRFKFWVSTLLFFAVIASCKKDIPTRQESQDKTSASSRASNDCLNLSAFCVADRVLAPDPGDVFARVTGGNGSWDLYRYELAPSETSFIAIDQNGAVQILSKTENTYLLDEGNGSQIVPELGAALDLPLEQIQTKSLDNSAIEEVYGEGVSIEFDGSIPSLTVSTGFDYPSDPNAVSFNSCQAVFEATVMTYMTLLPVPLSSQSTYEYVIQEALADCAGGDITDPSTYLDYHCVSNNCDSKCVVDNILGSFVFQNSDVENSHSLKLHYLNLLYGGMDDEVFTMLADEDVSEDAVNATFDFMTNPDNDICETINDFKDINDPKDFPEPPVPTIPNITVHSPTGNIGGCNKTNLVAVSDDRHPTDPDLQFGTGRLLPNIPPAYIQWNDNQLLGRWQVLNYATCYKKPSLIGVTNEFSNLVFSNTTNQLRHSNLQLNEACANTNEFKAFAQEVGKQLNDELSNGNDISTINIQLGNTRPWWSTPYRYKGLQILINDTEQTFVYSQTFQWMNPGQNHWKGTFCIKVEDNYGLDDPDAIKYGPKDGGFFTWWMLQHDRGKAPFINEIYILCEIEGKF